MLLGFFGHDLCYNRHEQANSGGATGGASGGNAQTSGATNGSGQGTSEGEGAKAENTDAAGEGGAAAPDTSATQDGKQEGKDGQSKTQTLTQEQIDAIVEKRLKEKEDRDKRAAERDSRKKQDDALVANKQFEELATARGKTIETLETENERLTRENAELKLGGTRAQIAAKYKLPARLAGRIQGTTEAEMDADAKALAADLAPPQAPNTEGGAGNRTPANGGATGTTTPPGNGQGQNQQGKPLYSFQQKTDVAW